MQMEDENYIDKFSYVYFEFKVRLVDLKRVKEQLFEFYLVLDLEGRVEILEFFVFLINVQIFEVVDCFYWYIFF